MSEPIYDSLIEALGRRGGAVPAIKCPELYSLVEELFTPEEAELASQMPANPISVADLAAETGRDPGEVGRLMDGMANKGLVISRERGGVDLFTVLQMMPGIFEYQFLKGEVSDRTRRLAHLFDDYLNVVAQSAQKGGAVVAFPFARVITVEEEITASVVIQPYERASHYINNADYITVSTCYCRHHGELLGQACGKPKEVCLTIGPGAKFNAERGFGRMISREEALKVLDFSEREGLVHCSTNMGKYIDFICNCCACDCMILRSVKNSAVPSAAATSGFIAMLDEELCTGCGDCVERCQMEALTLGDVVVARDVNRCIGCGLCISSCPSGALTMEERTDRPVPPWDRKSLNDAIFASLKMASS
ncbi:MAG: 4Fe-4S binding protein [Dehalococcoidia bacterium]